jgi:hypothetical protein
MRMRRLSAEVATAASIKDGGRWPARAWRGDALHCIAPRIGGAQCGANLTPLAASLVAARTGVPAVPVGIRGARSILRDGTWFPRLGAVAILIGAPVVPAGEDCIAAIKVRDQVRADMLRLSSELDRLG